ncbi:metal-dependent hydrolase [Halonotius terrestris]|uniref:Metal-dependent hydrolase n=1 Tax=Halonotius terrestris TaxID=2487750 RepID=A0A8J8P8E0_9EURY|nr:metal-dependent hydrolase [Halonotius terrestris]TQQ79324.1 metal-dependent hydrolase [Halonotius terrestris]
MWPWEHAALGYLTYSLSRRARGQAPPAELPTVALLFGTQLPDLIDKPLSWGLGIFTTGSALGHSLLFAVPLGLLIGVAAVRTDRRALGAGFVVGYWSHLVGDVVNPLRYGDPIAVDRVLWPFVAQEPYDQDLGLGRGLVYFGELFESLLSIDSVTLVVAYLLLTLATVALWFADGAPGVGLPGQLGERLRTRLERGRS